MCKFNQVKLVVVLLGITLLSGSCTKLVEISAPTDQVADNNVYTTDATAISVLTGIYIKMSQEGNFTGNRSITLLAGLSADELLLQSGTESITLVGYFQNKLSALDGVGSEHWGPLYNYIFKCNAAIEGLTSSTTLTQAVSQQLLGEAKFLRGFFYFYLVTMFGDLPLALTTDFKQNALLARSPKEIVYKQIIADLIDAKKLLSNDYLDGNLQLYTAEIERIRPTSWAATALLARAYLYAGDYANAESQAMMLINNAGLYTLSPLNDVFLKNSNEAIWQLQPVTYGHNTEEGRIFILPDTGPDVFGDKSFYLNTKLLNSFEISDQRAVEGNWINSVTVGGTTYYYPYKYKSGAQDDPLTEYLMVLRLGEQYLIRAEARAHLNNIPGAQADLNVIRTRAGLSSVNASDKETLLSAILHERQVELFTEWGHRWLDLKRTGNVDRVMSVVTPSKSSGEVWRSYQQWYPLPLKDIQTDPNLVQNAGY